jgi:hypothetical protein
LKKKGSSQGEKNLKNYVEAFVKTRIFLSLTNIFLAGSRFARFFLVQYTKTGKMYQMTPKCTKWPLNLPIGRTTYQMVLKDNSIFLLQEQPKFTQNGVWV